MKLLEKIKSGLFFLDGGMGTQLQARGLCAGELPERWNVTRADEVIAVHRAYLQAGADAITLNTFGANGLKYSDEELSEVLLGALSCAKKAIEAEDRGYLLLDLGPSGRLLKPYGDLDFEDAVSLFKRVVEIVKTEVDGVLIETVGDSYETKAMVLAVKETCDLPLLVTNIYGADGKLTMGSDIPATVALLEGLGVDAIGLNCSLGSAQMVELVGTVYEYSSIPVVVQPNAGLPKEEEGKTVYSEDAETFARNLLECVKRGARVVGGCCGTTPEYIQKVKEILSGVTPLPVVERNRSFVSSYTHAVEIGRSPLLIGERINPTGKKKFKQALKEGDTEYILGEALAQADAGAHVLDVNVGIPEIDEPSMLESTVCALQEVTDLPLQLDSSSVEALERSMRRYNGKPMVNSVNGKLSCMEAVFPLVKKYGGVCVALTLDEGGIPETAEGRLEIARKILAKAQEYGIAKKDLIFDPLAMAVSADKNAPNVTLQSLALMQKELGANTVLGVSNVSFGLPNREVVTSVFYTLALQNGLSCAILNPLSAEMKKAYYSFRALRGTDENCADYIAFAPTLTVSGTVEKKADALGADEGLKGAIVNGRKELSATLCEALLQEKTPVEIIDGEIVPALDEVGRGFEEKRVFLPQLLTSAEAAKCAFEKIKEKLAKAGEQTLKKCAVVLATVEGDIHDIGKNIVKALLENYAFRVIDLGKNVPPIEVVDTIVKEHAPIVGLSALMTTTVPAMRETVNLLREKAPWCKVVVGGAVITEEYAQELGADGYGKDAMATVRFCERVFSQGK